MLIKKIFFTLSIFGFLFLGCESENSGGESRTAAPGNTSQSLDFTLKTYDGKDFSLSEHLGKRVILLDFWATWCPPCRKGIPDLVELQKEFGNDLVVVGISLDDASTIKEVAPFVKEYKINYPVVIGNEAVSRQYGGIQAIPTTVLIDKSGKIIETIVGLSPISKYRQMIKAAI